MKATQTHTQMQKISHADKKKKKDHVASVASYLHLVLIVLLYTYVVYLFTTDVVYYTLLIRHRYVIWKKNGF